MPNQQRSTEETNALGSCPVMAEGYGFAPITERKLLPWQWVEAQMTVSRDYWVRTVDASQLGNPMPCEKWSVQDLRDHILGGLNMKISVMTDGADKAPEAGANSLATYGAGTTKVVEVANTPGMMEKQLQSPFCPITGAGWMIESFMDTLIHTWDLATATGQKYRHGSATSGSVLHSVCATD